MFKYMKVLAVMLLAMAASPAFAGSEVQVFGDADVSAVVENSVIVQSAIGSEVHQTMALGGIAAQNSKVTVGGKFKGSAVLKNAVVVQSAVGAGVYQALAIGGVAVQ